MHGEPLDVVCLEDPLAADPQRRLCHLSRRDGVDDLVPEGMTDISKIPTLVAGLMDRGYSDADILKVLGGNTLRVMREVEHLSHQMTADFLTGR